MFVVLEIQKLSESQVAIPTPIFTSSDWFEAESKFHYLCSIAAVSTVPVHIVMLIDCKGIINDMKVYEHDGL